jgi:hypothetical protein
MTIEKKNLHTLATLTALGLVLALGASTADAARRAQPQRDRAAGQWTRHTEGQRTENGRQSHGTVANRNGKEASRNVAVQRDAESGTRTRGVTETGFGGKSRSASTVSERTENGVTRSQTATRPNGREVSRDVAATRDPATGTFTKDVTVNGGAPTP